MPVITLTLEEKCYVIAVFGDLPLFKRRRLFGISKLPAQAGPGVMQAGQELADQLRRAGPMRRLHPLLDRDQ
jgi:hypothetical protein